MHKIICNCDCNHDYDYFEIMNNIHSSCAYVFTHVRQIMFNIMTCFMLYKYFVIGSFSNPKDKSNHV